MPGPNFFDFHVANKMRIPLKEREKKRDSTMA